MLRVSLEQRELLIGAGANVSGQGVIIVPEIRVRRLAQTPAVRCLRRPAARR